MLAKLQRVLNYKLSVATLIEIYLWILLPYVTVGLVWSAFHPANAAQMQAQLAGRLPAGAEVVALTFSALLWPVLLFTSFICPT